MEALLEKQSSEFSSVASDIQTVKASNVDRARRVSLSPSKSTMKDADINPLEKILETFFRNHDVQWSDMENARFFDGLVTLCETVVQGRLTEEIFISCLLNVFAITPAQAEKLYERLQEYQAETQPGQDPESELGLAATLSTCSLVRPTEFATLSNQEGEQDSISALTPEEKEHSLIAEGQNPIHAGRNVSIIEEDNLSVSEVYPAQDGPNSTDGSSQPQVVAEDQNPIPSGRNGSIIEEENLLSHGVYPAQDLPNIIDGDSQPQAPHQDSESSGTLEGLNISSESSSLFQYSNSTGGSSGMANPQS